MAEFINLDVKNIKGFGVGKQNDFWYNQIKVFKDFSKISVSSFKNSLAKNVDESYINLAQIFFTDLNTDTDWEAKFVIDSKVWDLKIVGNEDVPVSPDQKFDCFHNEDIKNIINKLSLIIQSAANICNKIILQHIEAGEFLKVDEIKLERILFAEKDGNLIKNFKNCSFKN